MRKDVFTALKRCETDVEGALERFYYDEDLYQKFLLSFLNEPTIRTLKSAIKAKNMESAFMAAHALKGVAGNLGFIPLYHAISELVLIIRSGNLDNIDQSYEQIRFYYNSLALAICQDQVLANTYLL